MPAVAFSTVLISAGSPSLHRRGWQRPSAGHRTYRSSVSLPRVWPFRPDWSKCPKAAKISPTV